MPRALRLISAVVMLAASACKHAPTAKEQQGAQIHYDLGIQAEQAGQVQAAFKEFEAALELDPGMEEAHNAIGILLHLSFHHYEEAAQHFQRALEIRPTFTEVKTNMGNLYLDQGRYDDAIRLYQDALNDMAYATPFIAEGNLGWALFKKGDLGQAVNHIQAALTLNPKFCLGYKNLGLIYEEQSKTVEACKQFDRYVEHCPEVADALYRDGICLAKLGRASEAKERFSACKDKADSDAVKDDCRQLEEKLR